MATVDKIQEIVDRLGDNNDGAELSSVWCPIHGNNHPSLVVRNESGFNATEVCIACVAELHKLLAQAAC